jgi:hypothetical protein
MKFNSLLFADSLEQKGFSVEQAKGIAPGTYFSCGAFECFDIEKLATKDEIKHLATKKISQDLSTLCSCNYWVSSLECKQ